MELLPGKPKIGTFGKLGDDGKQRFRTSRKEIDVGSRTSRTSRSIAFANRSLTHCR